MSVRTNTKNWLLFLGPDQIPCNIYTGPDGEAALRESHPYDGRRAVVQFLCPWEIRLDLAAFLLGTVDYQHGVIVRTPPFAYPLSPIDRDGGIFPARTVCTAIADIRGEGWYADLDGSYTGSPGWGAYLFAIITAEFTTPPYLVQPIAGAYGAAFSDLAGIPYCVTRTAVSGEVFAPPSGSFIYAAGTYANRALEDVTSMQLRARYELSVTRVRMPIFPQNTIDGLVGSVNQAPFNLGGVPVVEGAALFTGANPVPRVDPYNGGIVQDIELTWLVNAFTESQGSALDWNYFLDPGGAWTLVKNKTTGDPVFPYNDHAVLFADAIT